MSRLKNHTDYDYLMVLGVQKDEKAEETKDFFVEVSQTIKCVVRVVQVVLCVVIGLSLSKNHTNCDY